MTNGATQNIHFCCTVTNAWCLTQSIQHEVGLPCRDNAQTI